MSELDIEDLARRIETTPVDGKFGTRLFAMSDAERDLVVRLLRSHWDSSAEYSDTALTRIRELEQHLGEYKMLLDISARNTERRHDALQRILQLDGKFDLIDAQKIAYEAVSLSLSSKDQEKTNG